jgi:hypothetical protein
MDRSGNISKCGDKLLRHVLYEVSQFTSAQQQEALGAQVVGCEVGQACREQEGAGRGGAEARNHHAPDVAERFGFPARRSSHRGAA